MKTKTSCKITALITAAVLFAALMPGCKEPADNPAAKTGDICILYTNDVHCAGDENIGYDGLSAYKKSLEKKVGYLSLVDLGDFAQGDYVSSMTKGESSVRLMNKVGYDIAVPGNHEFDYGIERTEELTEIADFEFICCNITYKGKNKNRLTGFKPYVLKEYGDRKVAFIGVTTPYSIVTSSPASFMEDGELVYDFCSGPDGKNLQSRVQENIDACRKNGADYVILLTHLGDGDGTCRYSSTDLIRGTHGADAVLDGYSHKVIPSRLVKNDKNEDVILSSSGSRLENIGQLIITQNGFISSALISGWSDKDPDITSYMKETAASYKELLSEKVAKADIDLLLEDENGVRLVRNRECALGDFCADAYRIISGADIGIVNGGAIRDGFKKGDITNEDIRKVQPFGNTLCVVKATGEEIADALELSCAEVKAVSEENGKAAGESGGFLQVSGLRFTVDISVPSPVITDENRMFVKVEGERRVKDILVMDGSGEFLPLEPDKIYTVAAPDYTLLGRGDGYTMFADNDFVVKSGLLDYELMLKYITEHSGGVIDGNSVKNTGRINVI